MTNALVSRIEEEIAKREIKNGGRWCEVTMKKSGETMRIVRTGFGPFERPEDDSHEIHRYDGRVSAFSNLAELAEWMVAVNR